MSTGSGFYFKKIEEMRAREYWKLRRKLKHDLYKNKIKNEMKIQDEVALAETREIQRQANCSHDYSHKIAKKTYSDCGSYGTTYDVILVCRHCGKVVIV